MKVTFSEWKVEDHLKTAADRAAYVEAAAEEGTPDAMPDAFADVFRSLGNEAAATACAGIAAYLRTTSSGKPVTSVSSVPLRHRKRGNLFQTKALNK